MQISTKDWLNYVNLLTKLNDTAGKLMQEYVQKHGFGDTEGLIDYAYGLVTKYGEGSAALAAEMYDETARLSGKVLPPAEVADTASHGRVANEIKNTILRSVNPNSYGNTVSRLVKQAGADTTLINAERDGAYAAWVPMGDTCPFCITLASRGFQRVSKKTLKKGHAEHIHSNCDCAYTVRFDNSSGVKGYDPDKYLEMYQNAEGNTSKDKINSLRRMQYQDPEVRDKINAQKRAAYAERKAQEQKAESAKKYYMNYGAITEGAPQLLVAGGDAGDSVMSCIKVDFEGKSVYISDRIIESPEVVMDKVEPYLIEGLDAVGRDHGELPDFIIADVTELSGANGRYLYDSNTVVLVPKVFGDAAENDEYNAHLSFHELLHWSDCQDEAKINPGLKEDDLVAIITEKSRETLDKLGINTYNVDEISDYAEAAFDKGRYDEVLVEYRVKGLMEDRKG